MPSSPSGKGQAAIEYLMIFGIALTLSAPFVLEAQNSVFNLQINSQVVDVQNSLDKLDSAAKTVNAAGPPSRRTFRMEVPSIVSKSYVLENAVIYEVETADQVANYSRSFDFKVDGTLPTEEGTYSITVTAKKDVVEVQPR